MSRGDTVPVPFAVLARDDVSWAAKVLLGVLVKRAEDAAGAPTIDELAAQMTSPRRTLQRWLSELEQAGLVAIARTGRASSYEPVGTSATHRRCARCETPLGPQAPPWCHVCELEHEPPTSPPHQLVITISIPWGA